MLSKLKSPLKLSRYKNYMSSLLVSSIKMNVFNLPFTLIKCNNIQSRHFSKKKKIKSLSSSKMIELQEVADNNYYNGIIYKNNGEFIKAEYELVKCLTSRILIFQTDHHDHIITCLNALGNLYTLCNRPDLSINILERALNAARIVHGNNSYNVVPTLTLLSAALNASNPPDHDKAEEYINLATKITKDINPDPKNPKLASRLDEMGSIQFYRGDAEAAYKSFNEALEIRKFAFGDYLKYADSIRINFGSKNNTIEPSEIDLPHPEIFLSLCHIGLIEFFRKNTEASVNFLIPAVHLQHFLLNSNVVQPNFFIHEVLSSNLCKSNNLVEAASSMHYATTLCRIRYPNNPVICRALINEANILRFCAMMTDLESMSKLNGGNSMRHEVSSDEYNIRAEALLKEALEIGTENYGPNHPVTLKAAIDLCDIFILKKGFAQAIDLANIYLETAHEKVEISSKPPTTTEDLCLPLQLSESDALSEEYPPFGAIYPSFKKESKNIYISELHRIIADSLIKLNGNIEDIKSHILKGKELVDINHPLNQRFEKLSQLIQN